MFRKRRVSTIAEQDLESMSPYPSSNVPKQDGFQRKASVPDMYYSFRCLQLQNIRFDVSKMLMEWSLIYASSETASAGRRMSLLTNRNSLPMAGPRDSGGKSINVDFSKCDVWADLNELHANDGMRRMLDGDYFV